MKWDIFTGELLKDHPYEGTEDFTDFTFVPVADLNSNMNLRGLADYSIIQSPDG